MVHQFTMLSLIAVFLAVIQARETCPAGFVEMQGQTVDSSLTTTTDGIEACAEACDFECNSFQYSPIANANGRGECARFANSSPEDTTANRGPDFVFCSRESSNVDTTPSKRGGPFQDREPKTQRSNPETQPAAKDSTMNNTNAGEESAISGMTLVVAVLFALVLMVWGSCFVSKFVETHNSQLTDKRLPTTQGDVEMGNSPPKDDVVESASGASQQAI